MAVAYTAKGDRFVAEKSRVWLAKLGGFRNGFGTAWDLAPDGKRVVISSLRTGDLFIYDVASHKELKRLNIGHGGAGILVDTDGSRVFVGCTADNYVAVVDLRTLEVTGHIEMGGGPDGLAWAVRP